MDFLKAKKTAKEWLNEDSSTIKESFSDSIKYLQKKADLLSGTKINKVTIQGDETAILELSNGMYVSTQGLGWL